MHLLLIECAKNKYSGIDIDTWIIGFENLLSDITHESKEILTPSEWAYCFQGHEDPDLVSGRLFEIKLEKLRDITVKHLQLYILPIFDFRRHLEKTPVTSLILLADDSGYLFNNPLFLGFWDFIKMVDFSFFYYTHDDLEEDMGFSEKDDFLHKLEAKDALKKGLKLRDAKIKISYHQMEAWIHKAKELYENHRPEISLDMTWCFSSPHDYRWKFPQFYNASTRFMNSFNLGDILRVLQTIDEFKSDTISPSNLLSISNLLYERGFFQEVNDSANSILRAFLEQEIESIKPLIRSDR